MIRLAEKFGWTLDEIRKMSMKEFNMILEIIAGENQAIKTIRQNPKAFGLGD